MVKVKTRAEKMHMDRVAALGCIIANYECGGRLELHHITGAGMGKKASHYETIGLCTNHHSAQTPLPFGHAVHKGTRSFEARYGTQEELLERVRSLLGIGAEHELTKYLPRE